MACKWRPRLYLFSSWSCGQELFSFPLLCAAQIARGSFMDGSPLAEGNNRKLSCIILPGLLWSVLHLLWGFSWRNNQRQALLNKMFTCVTFVSFCSTIFMPNLSFTNAELFLAQLFVQTDDHMKALDKYDRHTCSVHRFPLILNCIWLIFGDSIRLDFGWYFFYISDLSHQQHVPLTTVITSAAPRNVSDPGLARRNVSPDNNYIPSIGFSSSSVFAFGLPTCTLFVSDSLQNSAH